MTKYLTGQSIRLQCVFKTFDDVATNPTTIILKYKKPSGNITTVTTGFTNSTVGTYQYTLELDEVGTWEYRWEGTGTVDTVNKSLFIVESGDL